LGIFNTYGITTLPNFVGSNPGFSLYSGRIKDDFARLKDKDTSK